MVEEPNREQIEVVLHPLHGPGLGEALSNVSGVSLLTPATSDEVASFLTGGTEALVTFDWEDEFLTPHLRWVQAISAGVDQFPTDRLREAGIVLTSARGAHSPAVAEHAVSLVLALTRRLGPAVRRAARHEWAPEIATEIAGRTSCVVGLGSIGSEIAQKLQALGSSVIGVRRHPAPSRFADRVVAPDGLMEAFREADVVVCALPHADDTMSLIGPDELAALGRGWLVNVGRGSSVDEAALVRALVDGELQGAALDVTAVEPLPAESPLWDLPEVIITPHMAWATDRLTPRLVDIISRNLAAYRKEDEWLNRVV